MLIQSSTALTAEEAFVLTKLLSVWRAKVPRNVLRDVYFEGKQAFKDFGVAIPPQILDKIDPVLGWVETGVRALTDRSKLEGFVSADSQDEDPFGVNDLIYQNSFMSIFPQASLSSAIHSCAFLTVDDTIGTLRIRARSADMSAAIWDFERHEVGAYLVITKLRDGIPVEMMMHLHEAVVRIEVSASSGRVTVERFRNPLGRVSVAPLPLKPSLKRPFGHSRISRAAMSFTDSGLRTITRSEVQGEAFAGPQYWLLGSDAEAFAGNNRFKAVMGRVFGLEQGEDDDNVPDVKRFEGASPQAHIDHLRMWATLFAGDQGVPVSSLGVVQDNPSSAEAIYAAKEDLITNTKNANDSWGAGAESAMRMAVEWRDGALPDAMKTLSANFTSPETVSPGSRADAFSKLSASVPGFAESEVGLEYGGLSREQIVRFQAERRRSNVSDLVAGIAGRLDAQALADTQAARGSGTVQ